MAANLDVEHIVALVDCVIVMANNKWIEPRKFMMQQPGPNKVKVMIKQLEKMTLAEKIRWTTLLAWRWPRALMSVLENMRGKEIRLKDKTRQSARRAVLNKAKAVVARGTAKVAAVRRPRAKAKTIVASMAVLAAAKGKVIKTARTLRRLPEGDRKDSGELFMYIKGSSCKPVPVDETLEEGHARSLLPVPVVMAASSSLPHPLPPPRRVPGPQRRVCIRRRVELRKYGFTEGCIGCVWAAQASSTRAKGHSDECRIRIVELLRVDESDRRTQMMTETTRRGVRSGVLPFRT
jgi:hypothetical protein